MSEKVTRAEPGRIYIVGGGIAGMLLAERVAAHAEARGEPAPAMTIIDRNSAIAQGSSEAYGGFITANSYETVNFNNSTHAQAISKAYDAGGWALHPPTPAEKRWIKEVGRYADKPTEEKIYERTLYHQFGYGCIGLWKELFTRHPGLAEKCGFNYSSGEGDDGVLRIYKASAGKTREMIDSEIDFLHQTGADGLHTRHVAGGMDGDQHVRQHGGSMNGKVFCEALAENLRQRGCDLQFMGNQEVAGIDYSSNVNRIKGLRLRDVASGTERVIGAFTDRFIFATGASNDLWSQLGFSSAPVMGVAGTSLTLPVPNDIPDKPAGATKFVDDSGGPVMIPLRDTNGTPQLRVGGYTAFCGERLPNRDDAFAKDFLSRQLAMLEREYPALAERFIRDELHGDRDAIAHYAGSWVGCRPVTPDNYAIAGPIQRAPAKGEPSSGVENGYLLTGLGAAGFLGIGAADILAQRMETPDRRPQVPGLKSPEDLQALLAMVDPERLSAFRQPLRVAGLGA